MIGLQHLDAIAARGEAIEPGVPQQPVRAIDADHMGGALIPGRAVEHVGQRVDGQVVVAESLAEQGEATAAVESLQVLTQTRPAGQVAR